jgi:hypothetical protein
MDSNQSYNIGKIRAYDNYIGEIIAKDGTYIFVNEDNINNEKFKLNDIVMFRGEEIQGLKKAFFVKKLTSEKNFEEEIKNNFKK